MALNLDGSYEQIKFHDYESVLLYNNTQYETYVPHWHASTEIIMPVKGDYTIICNGTNYYLKERDILIIAPGTVHSIPACHGQRYIFWQISSIILNLTVFNNSGSTLSSYTDQREHTP